MLNTLLRDSDVMSMAHGLELRVPLIDHQLADKLMALPGAWKLDGDTPKPLLVGALKGRCRTKLFTARSRASLSPLSVGCGRICGLKWKLALPKIGRGPLGSLLNYDSVAQVWDDFLSQRTSWSRIWSLYVLEQWCELNSVSA